MVGDIVLVGTKGDEPWTVTQFAGGNSWWVRRDESHRSVSFVTADLSLLLRPAINIGDEMRLNGSTVRVTGFLGNAVKVEIAAKDRRVPLRHGGTAAFGVGSAVIGRGELVAENANELLRAHGG